MRKQLLATAGGGSVITAGWPARRYRHDLDAARARLAAVDRTGIETAFGAVEYAERGRSWPGSPESRKGSRSPPPTRAPSPP
jgi:hypothetical protein